MGEWPLTRLSRVGEEAGNPSSVVAAGAVGVPGGACGASWAEGRSAWWPRWWCVITRLDECPRILVVGARSGRKQGWVLGEDRPLQHSQLLRWFDAVAADECL